MIAKVLTVLLLFFAVSKARAGEIETKLLRSDNGLLGAMRRVGCRATWLSVVMRQSNILESELDTLPPGAKLYMPGVCGTKLPPHEDRQITRQIFQHQSALRNIEQTEKDKDFLTQENEELKTELKIQMNLVAELQKKNQELSVLAKTLTKSSARPSRFVFTGYATFGFFSCLVLCVLWRFLWLPRFGSLVYNNQKVFYAGGVKSFLLANVTYKCSQHPDQEIKREHLLRHLQRAHVSERLSVTVVDKGFAVGS